MDFEFPVAKGFTLRRSNRAATTASPWPSRLLPWPRTALAPSLERNAPGCPSLSFLVHCGKSLANMEPLLDLALPGLIHDLNNVFQTLMEAADALSGDPRWTGLSAAIFRSIERGREITLSMQETGQPSAPFETVLYNARTLVEDSMM